MQLLMRGRVYDDMARHGGIAAVPLNQHGHAASERATDGVPLCRQGLRMHPTYQFAHTYGYRAQRFRCSFLTPQEPPAIMNSLARAKAVSKMSIGSSVGRCV